MPRKNHLYLQALAKCKTYEDLLQLEREKGYRQGWAGYIWKARQKKQKAKKELAIDA